MPFVDLRLRPAITGAPARVLARDIADAVAGVAGKRPERTVVRSEAGEVRWCIGGAACTHPAADRGARIAGSNTPAEKAHA